MSERGRERHVYVNEGIKERERERMCVFMGGRERENVCIYGGGGREGERETTFQLDALLLLAFVAL